MQEQYLDASCKLDIRGARKITQQELERKETVYASLEALYAIPLNPYCFYRPGFYLTVLGCSLAALCRTPLSTDVTLGKAASSHGRFSAAAIRAEGRRPLLLRRAQARDNMDVLYLTMEAIWVWKAYSLKPGYHISSCLV